MSAQSSIDNDRALPAVAPPVPPPNVLSERTPWLSLLPLLLSIPFMYWPQVIESDTQPWVAMGAIFAALFYWPPRADFARAFPIWPTLLGLLAIAAYYVRGPDTDLFLRYAAILLTFIALWHVGNRGVHPIVGDFVRFAIVLWFVVGAYQIIALRLGLPVDFFGRFVAGRGGIPSLTAEPSYFGSISVLHLMFLLAAERRRIDWLFYLIAIANVAMSGSILSFALLVVPFIFRVPMRFKLLAGFGLLIVIVFGVEIAGLGIFARFASLQTASFADILLVDYSTNLRAGHVVYTFVAGLPDELLFRNSVDFFYEYNRWAYSTRLFVFNDSGFILPSGGELLFRSGSAGLLLILIMLKYAWQTETTLVNKLEKIVFVFACLLNPISLTNPVFVLYILKSRSGGQGGVEHASQPSPMIADEQRN